MQNSTTPIFYAARSGRYRMVKLLCDHGASPLSKNAGNDTVLMFCGSGASEKHPIGTDPPAFGKVACYLLDMGVRIDDVNKNGLNVLHCAANSFEVISAIADWCAESEARKTQFSQAVHQKTVLGDTPLHMAAEESNPNVIAALLAADADPLAVNKSGKIPSACAIDQVCLSVLKSAESVANQRYREMQDLLLAELSGEAAYSRTKLKSKSSKKSRRGRKLSPESSTNQSVAPNNDATDIAPPALPKSPPPAVSGEHITAMLHSILEPSLRTPEQDKTTEMDEAERDSPERRASPPTPSDSPSWAAIAKGTPPPTSPSSVSPDPASTALKKVNAPMIGSSIDHPIIDITDETVEKEELPTLSRKGSVPSNSRSHQTSPRDEYTTTLLAQAFPRAEVLGLRIHHALGIGLAALSMEQLDALEEFFRHTIASVTNAKVELVRKQEKAYYEEELARYVQVHERLKAPLP